MNNSSYNQAPYRAFGEKFDAVMRLSDMSNVLFGRLVNMDASYISRFRSGTRSPRSNPKAVEDICDVLLRRLKDQGRIGELADFMHVSPETVSDDDELFATFRSWLFDIEKDDGAQMAEKLLENIDAFSPDASMMEAAMKLAEADEAGEGPRSVYFGADGLQSAVLRFLRDAAAAGPGELLLYSDQSMDWMVNDSQFLMKWAALMLRCVKSGVYIRIIHNVDRNLDEMMQAIVSWLPLYMSGRIESYYCKKQRNLRFSNTIFLRPGMACIKGSNFAGTENEIGVYRYDTDRELLDLHRCIYDRLLSESRALVRIYGNSELADRLIASSAYTVPNLPFKNVQVAISERSVDVSRLAAPKVTFTITHPALCRAFAAYAEKAGEK